MAADNDRTQEPTIFSAVLTPHRSLGRKGFLILMTVLGLISFATGTAFLLAGAWPVFGFCGLDVLLIYFAFR
jgi:Integral membrane protein